MSSNNLNVSGGAGLSPPLGHNNNTHADRSQATHAPPLQRLSTASSTPSVSSDHQTVESADGQRRQISTGAGRIRFNSPPSDDTSSITSANDFGNLHSLGAGAGTGAEKFPSTVEGTKSFLKNTLDGAQSSLLPMITEIKDCEEKGNAATPQEQELAKQAKDVLGMLFHVEGDTPPTVSLKLSEDEIPQDYKAVDLMAKYLDVETPDADKETCLTALTGAELFKGHGAGDIQQIKNVLNFSEKIIEHSDAKPNGAPGKLTDEEKAGLQESINNLNKLLKDYESAETAAAQGDDPEAIKMQHDHAAKMAQLVQKMLQECISAMLKVAQAYSRLASEGHALISVGIR